MPQFDEVEFQKKYWKYYQQTGIVDGGIFHCNMNSFEKKGITGSWTSGEELAKIGYKTTRLSNIVPRDQYMVAQIS